MQVECRGNMFTMPRRRRFKPRKDCEAILGKLSSYSSLYHYITIPPLFEGSTNIYNPPQTPPFEKEGLVVARWATLPMAGVVNGLMGLIDIREFRETNEIRDISEINEDVIGLGLL